VEAGCSEFQREWRPLVPSGYKQLAREERDIRRAADDTDI